jgi:hypothetical protein
MGAPTLGIIVFGLLLERGRPVVAGDTEAATSSKRPKSHV